jgi:hypothetical protein
LSVKILKEGYLCSGLTQPPAHGTHSRKRKRKVRITGFLTQSSNKGRWSTTARRSLGGEALMGLGKAMLMRERHRHKDFELIEGAAQRFSRERQRHTKIFEWVEGFCIFLKKFKSLRINNGFYQKTVVVYGESAMVFW